MKRIVVLLVALWAAVAALLFVQHHDDRPVRANAVVVLAGSKTRLPVGLQLMQEQYAPTLVVSVGGHSTLERRVCAGLTEYRVICFHPDPYSTTGEARYVTELAAEKGWTRLDVVTSEFHVYRAGMLFRRCFRGELRMVGAPDETWKLPWYMVSESAKLLFQKTLARSC